MIGWRPPLPLGLLPSLDADSFASSPEGWTCIPIPGAGHPGAFGAARKYHAHEGVDLYCPAGTAVSAVEAGVVVAVLPFTGAMADSPWWLDTWAVMVEGASGVVLYGEIDPARGLAVGRRLLSGDPVGSVRRVLRSDKGRPTAMLHLELYADGSTEPVEWRVDTEGWPVEKPPNLRDPTPMLVDAAFRSWPRLPMSRPFVVKAGSALIPLTRIEGIDIADVERAAVFVTHSGGKVDVSYGLDAFETVWAVKPSALEGRRLGWNKGAWAFHNVVAHPLMQVMAWLGFGRQAVALHDATTPVARDTKR